MASLFEQYEQATQALATSKLGLISTTSEQVEPMFTKRRVNFRPSAPVTDMVVSNGQLVLAMANKVIIRVDLVQPNEHEEIDVSKLIDIKSKLHNLFLDFTGSHLLVGVMSSSVNVSVDVLYLNRNSKKPKSASKLKGHGITAVAWDARTATVTSSGPALIGTKKGLIFETAFNVVEDKYTSVSSVEQYWKQLYDLSVDCTTSITGIEYYLVSETNNMAFVLVTTPIRLYQFVGQIPSSMDPPVLLNVFNNYSHLSMRFQEIPSHVPYSRLQFFYPTAWSLPKSFAWMTGVGVQHGRLDYSGQAGPDTVCSDVKLITYKREEKTGGNDNSAADCPMSVVLTEFHILLLYGDRVKALCVLNEDVIMEDVYTETYGNMVCLVKDPIKGTIWACSEYAVYKYSISQEDRHVWQVYLNRREYDLAKQYCRNNVEMLDAVLSRQALDYFEQANYEESANYYAMTRVSFEEVALKFLQMEKKTALKTYLLKKLNGLKLQDKIQTTMIVTWLVELFLNEIGKRQDCSEQSAGASSVRKEFYAFLSMPKVKECVSNNRQVIYDLVASHGDQQSLACFANLIEDFERMIRFHIQNGAYREALEVLQKQNVIDYYYQYCPILMQYIPKETVDACIALGHRLDPLRLIPVMVHYNNHLSQCQASQKNEAIRYLEFCVQTLDCKEQRIHNYLLTLYAKISPERLVPYLVSQGQDYAAVCYDLEYALRVCSECDHQAACVHIYCTMGLYEEAVDLSLKFDVDLAKRCADKPEENEELQKKLWLKIARHVVKEENDIKKAMEFLQECDLIKIEDILPFFPSFVTIDHFKDAICQSLQEYNQHIEGLKEDMEEATQSTRQIRSEIQIFRNKYISVRSQDKCSTCTYPVITRSFYMFPCHHNFHTECLISEVVPNLTQTKRNRIEEIQKILTTFAAQEEVHLTTPGSLSGSLPVLTTREHLRMELDDIIANECPYCGDLVIKNVDEPFIDQNELEDIIKSWE